MCIHVCYDMAVGAPRRRGHGVLLRRRRGLPGDLPSTRTVQHRLEPFSAASRVLSTRPKLTVHVMQDGTPTTCDFFCAEKYVPLYDRCHDLLTQMVADNVDAFDALVDTCLTSDAETIQNVFDDVRSHEHCVFDESFVDDRDTAGGGYGPPAGPGGGHRRTQFGHFGGHDAGGETCPMDTFDDRARTVDEACGLGDGVPTSCSTDCALDFKVRAALRNHSSHAVRRCGAERLCAGPLEPLELFSVAKSRALTRAKPTARRACEAVL